MADRPKASLAFAEDLETAFDLVLSLPGAGFRYYLYYTVDSDEELVRVWLSGMPVGLQI